MGMNPQTIGKAMPHGFAGSYARQPDMIVGARPAGGTVPILFGAPLKYDAAGAVVPMGEGDTADVFAGIASREIKSSLNYLDQSAGSYAPGEAVSVFQRGCINVRCQKGTPKLGGAVYVRLAADEENPAASCRNADRPYGPDNYRVTVDGFIVSDNVEVRRARVWETGFRWSDHNPVYMDFVLQ